MENCFYKPKSNALADTVQFMWQVDRCNMNFRKEVIVPKGNIEIIFSFNQSDKFFAQIDSLNYSLPRCFINGFNTSPIHLQLPLKQFFFGVVFHPTAIKRIFGVPASEFANQCVDMTLVDGSLNSLWHQLAEQQNFNQRVRVLSVWLQKRLAFLTKREKKFNDFLTQWSDSTLSVNQAADRLCYSSRHLSRKVKEHTGMNLEQKLLYKKYVQAIHLIHHTELSLTEVANSCYFYDQSHFIKTFKSFAHLTPSEYKIAKSHVVGHIFQDVRVIQS